MTNFDIIVLTAANETQAESYRRELAWRRENNVLPSDTKTLVVSDPGGKRVGSFAATLNLIDIIADNEDFKCNDKPYPSVLVCHSGGDSRRTPAYAAKGKVFTPVPARGKNNSPLAIFDLIVENCQKLNLPESGMLIASGDVVLTFGDADLCRMDFSRPGVTGIGYYDTIEQGSRHGVYVADNTNERSRTNCAVTDFLQKPDRATAEMHGAFTDDDKMIIDTGLFFIEPDVIQNLKSFAADGILQEIKKGTLPSIDLYEEFAIALVPSINKEKYLKRFDKKICQSTNYGKYIDRLFDICRRIQFSLCVASICDFFHIGSSKELLHGFKEETLTTKTFNFAHNKRADKSINGEGAFVFNSPDCKVNSAANALIENCAYRGELNLAGDNIVTGLPECEAISINLPPKVGLVIMRLQNGLWTAITYGIEDDFKTPYNPGEKPCLFLNNPVDEWMTRQSISASDLWQNDEISGIWSARIWRAASLNEVLNDAILCAGGSVKWAPSYTPEAVSFNNAKRYGISELIPMAAN